MNAGFKASLLMVLFTTGVAVMVPFLVHNNAIQQVLSVAPPRFD